jgi:hypothetical protein
VHESMEVHGWLPCFFRFVILSEVMPFAFVNSIT